MRIRMGGKKLTTGELGKNEGYNIPKDANKRFKKQMAAIRKRLLLSNVVKMKDLKSNFVDGINDLTINKKVRDNILLVKSLLKSPQKTEHPL